uniref:CUB domain-containing protein n=1 Tax=Timema monikensis TaxID=170555 RepID=A0A7R9E092_9NEOP|nr:unnamed protein product [Timema monikensis]
MKKDCTLGLDLEVSSQGDPTVCPVCGGDLTGDSGYVSSPPASLNLSSYYCIWERVTPSTANETLTFTVLNGTFGATPYPNCLFYGTHLSIRAAADEIKLADLCANATTPLVYPSPFSMNKVFGIQSSYESSGKMNFTLKYSSSPCGGVLNGPEETVSSPNYPNNYPPNTDCAWSVSYPEGQAIKIHFISLNMEADCEKDYLLIHSGHIPSSPRIGRYCGNSPPSDITSHSNTLWIAFHSDAETQGQGFQLTLEPVTGGCGGIIIGANKEISTPNFPKIYPNNAECDWEIRVDDGYTIQLDFVERFYIENSSNCQNDFVEAFDYINEQWVSFGRQCGRNIPTHIKGTTNKMRVLFRSNSQIQADGFKARWKTNCGGVITNKTFGHVMSPGYPLIKAAACGGNITEQRLIKSPVNNNQLNNRVRCNWLITAPVGKRVTLRFTSLKIEYHASCNYDYIEAYDDKTTNEKHRMGRYCGNLDSNPPKIHSTGRYLSLLFITDGSSQGEGFLASVMFTTVCGGLMNVSQQMQTLRYPVSGKYATFLDCAWTLVAPLGQIIQLKITSLDMASCFNMSTASCDCDYLEVHDGVSQYSDLIGRFCGNTAPPAFTSSSNKMWIHFVSDGTENRNGFQVQYHGKHREFGTICGNSTLNVTSSLQELTSPNYPGNYPVNIRCRWLLTFGPVGNRWSSINKIYIHFKELDLETGGDDCRNDWLQVSDINEVALRVSHSSLMSSGEMKPRSGDWMNNNRFISEGLEQEYIFSGQSSDGISMYHEVALCVSHSLLISSDRMKPRSGDWAVMINFLQEAAMISFIHWQQCKLERSINICIRETSNTLTVPHPPTLPLSSSVPYSTSQFLSPSATLKECLPLQGSRQPSGKGTFCGHGEPLDYYSNSANVQIVFVSNFNVTARGFKIQYGLQGEDDWLTVHSGLTVRDGLTPSSPRLAKLCGYQIPSPIFSNTSALRLFRHQKRASAGFYDVTDITYTTTDQGPGCGGTVFNFGGVFTSPFYPGNYRNTSKCRWDVMVPTGLTDVPAVYEGVSAHVVVRYTSSVHNGGTGWVLHFMGKVPGHCVAIIFVSAVLLVTGVGQDIKIDTTSSMPANSTCLYPPLPTSKTMFPRA